MHNHPSTIVQVSSEAAVVFSLPGGVCTGGRWGPTLCGNGRESGVCCTNDTLPLGSIWSSGLCVKAKACGSGAGNVNVMAIPVLTTSAVTAGVGALGTIISSTLRGTCSNRSSDTLRIRGSHLMKMDHILTGGIVMSKRVGMHWQWWRISESVQQSVDSDERKVINTVRGVGTARLSKASLSYSYLLYCWPFRWSPTSGKWCSSGGILVPFVETILECWLEIRLEATCVR